MSKETSGYDEKGGVWADEKIDDRRDKSRRDSRREEKEKEKKSKRKKSPRGSDDDGKPGAVINDSLVLPDAEMDFNVESTLPKSWADWLGVIGPPSKMEGGVPTRINRRPGSLESVRLGPERVVERVKVDGDALPASTPKRPKKAGSLESVAADPKRRKKAASEESVSPTKPRRERANSEESVFLPRKRRDKEWDFPREERRRRGSGDYQRSRDRRQRKRASSSESLMPDKARRSPVRRRRSRATSLESVFDKSAARDEKNEEIGGERRRRAASEESVMDRKGDGEKEKEESRNSKEKKSKRRKRARSLESVLSRGSEEDKEDDDDWRNKALVPWRKENWAVAKIDERDSKTKKGSKKEEKGYDPRPSQDLNAWAEWAGKLALITNKRQIQTSWIFEADSASEDSDDGGLTEAEKKEKEERKEKKRLKRERKKKLREQAKRLKLLPQNWEDWKKDRNYREGSVAPKDRKSYGPYDDLDPEMDPDFWKSDEKEGVPLSKDYKSKKERKRETNIEITNMTKEMIELEKEIAKGPNATDEINAPPATKMGIVDQLAMSEKDFDFRDYSGMGIAHRKKMREREEEAKLMHDPFYRERQEQKMRQSRLLRTGFTSWTSGGALNSGHVRYTAAHSSLPSHVPGKEGKDWYWDGERWTMKEIASKPSGTLADHMATNPNAYDAVKSTSGFKSVTQAEEDEATKNYTVVDNMEEWENAELEEDAFDADDVWENDLLLSQNFLSGSAKAKAEAEARAKESASSRTKSRFAAPTTRADAEDGEVSEEAFLAETMREIRESVNEFTGPIVPRKIEMEGGRRPRAPHPHHAFQAQNAFRASDGTPSFSFQGLVIYCGNRNDCDWYCQRIMRDLNHLLESYAPLPVYVGLHCQWSPQLIKGYPENKVSLLTITPSPERCYLFHLSNMTPPGIPLSLRRILEDRRMVKTGHGIHEFFKKLGRDYRLTCAEDIIATSTVELLDYSVEILGTPATFGPWAMRKLVEVLMDGMVIPKMRKHEVTPWSIYPLNKAMKCFAATEAYASLEIFMCLKMIQCDLAHMSTEHMDTILPILNPPPPPPPPNLLPPPPPEEDMEEGEVLSDDEAQAARESRLKEKERLKMEQELAEKEKAEKAKAELVAKEMEEQKAKTAEEEKRKAMEEERKRQEEEDKGKKDVAVSRRLPISDQRAGRNTKKNEQRRESMLKQLVREFHSQPTALHQPATESSDAEGESADSTAKSESQPDNPIFITVLGLEEEKPTRRSPSPHRHYSNRVRPLMSSSYSSRSSRGSYPDPRDDPRDIRYRGKDRSYAREPPSVREPYYARRDRESSSQSSQRPFDSRDRYPSRRSPDRNRRSPTPPPKLLSYWEDDNFADLQSFDDKKRKNTDEKGKEKKEKPLPRLQGDYGYFCYDQDGSDSDEEFNLKYQSYYDMMEAGDPLVKAAKEKAEAAGGEGGKRKEKRKSREKGKSREGDKVKNKSKEKSIEQGEQVTGASEQRGEEKSADGASSNAGKVEDNGGEGGSSAEGISESEKGKDGGRIVGSESVKPGNIADHRVEKLKIVIAPLRSRLPIAAGSGSGSKTKSTEEEKKRKEKKERKDKKEGKKKEEKDESSKLPKKLKKCVDEQIASNLKFGPEDADIVKERLKHLTAKSKKKKHKSEKK